MLPLVRGAAWVQELMGCFTDKNRKINLYFKKVRELNMIHCASSCRVRLKCH